MRSAIDQNVIVMRQVDDVVSRSETGPPALQRHARRRRRLDRARRNDEAIGRAPSNPTSDRPGRSCQRRTSPSSLTLKFSGRPGNRSFIGAHQPEMRRNAVAVSARRFCCAALRVRIGTSPSATVEPVAAEQRRKARPVIGHVALGMPEQRVEQALLVGLELRRGELLGIRESLAELEHHLIDSIGHERGGRALCAKT